jgi:hypothetical protein
MSPRFASANTSTPDACNAPIVRSSTANPSAPNASKNAT